MEIKLLQYEALESTNKTAAEAARAGAAEGTVIVAARQTGGRGRMTRSFASPPGGLYFSLILRPQIDPQYVAQLTLLAGVAVAQSLRSLYDTEEICIKWPNDLLWGGKKLCGILSELTLRADGAVDYVIVGIGVNLALAREDFPAELQPVATSLLLETGKRLPTSEVLEGILSAAAELYGRWLTDGPAEVLRLWRRLNCTLGREVLVKDNDEVIFRGRALDIDDKGAVVIGADGAARSFDFGEISLR